MIFGYPYLEKQIMAGRQTQIGRSMISLWSNTLIEDFQANHGWLLKSIMYETDNVHPEMMILKLSWRIYNQWVDILGIYNYIYIHIIYIHIIYIYIYIYYIHMYVYTQRYSFHMDLNASPEKEVCTTRKPFGPHTPSQGTWIHWAYDGLTSSLFPHCCWWCFLPLIITIFLLILKNRIFFRLYL